MHLIRSLVIYVLFLFVNFTKQDESVVSFNPSSISFFVGENKSVSARLTKRDIKFPVTIEFLYDGETNNTRHLVDTIQNVTFINDTTDDRKQIFHIYGYHQGHLVLTAQSSEVNISTAADYILIDIGRSKLIDIFIQIVGWVYFFAWSISFYPQIILNFQRKSVIGLNFDFLALNILGHSCYSVFNVVLYTNFKVQQEYHDKHPHGVLPVLLNDVIFSCHAVFACLVTVIQCLMYERGGQRVSYTARILACIGIVFLFISTIISLTHHLTTLSLLYFFSYVKLAITIIKYCPQAWMNFRRKSTDGWSIGNILLDFTGGVLSLLQMFLLSTNYNDWSSIFGSPTKLGLALFSILFDILFIVQHYILYRGNDHKDKRINASNDDYNERSPILPNKT